MSYIFFKKIIDQLFYVCYPKDVCKCFVSFRLHLQGERATNKRGRLTKLIRKNKKKMAKKLYVGGLPYATSEDALKELFSQAGTVESANIITDRMSGRSKGFGFVEMSSEEEAQKAIDMFHGKEYEGRNLTVNEARPLEERPKRSFDGGDRRY